MNRALQKFSVFDLIIIAFSAALGVAVKPVVVSVSHLITGPLMIPGGAFAGGIYMLFIVLGAGITEKRGSATLICTVQALMVMLTAVYGTHGVASLVTYILPGIAIDVLWLFLARRGITLLACFFGCIVANTTGVLLVNLVFFRLPLLPLLLTASVGALSGGVGGVAAWLLLKGVRARMK